MMTARCVAAVLVAAGAAAMAGAQTSGSFRQFAAVDVYRTYALDRVEDVYLRSLDHSNPGVVESAIGNVTRHKVAQPGYCSDALQNRLRALAVEGATPAIRYKASLASLLCDRTELFVDLRNADFRTSQDLFTAIARRLEESTLRIVSR